MSLNRGPSSRFRAGPAKGESSATEARLDQILNSQSTRPGGLSGSALPSRLDQRLGTGSSPGFINTPQGNISSPIGAFPQSQGPFRQGLPSRLDRSRRYTPLSPLAQQGQHRTPSLGDNMRSGLDRFGRGNSSLRHPLDNLGPLHPTNTPSGPSGPGSGGEVQPAIKTAFTNPHDIAMASRQVQYESLPPEEKKKQDEWANEKIQTLGPCPQGFGWLRVNGGYNCWPGSHWTSDELVAEGKGGFYVHRRDVIRYNLAVEREIGFSQGLARFSPPFYSIEEMTKWQWGSGGSQLRLGYVNAAY